MLNSITSPRLIAIDMDGTLLNSDGQVSARNLAALRAADAHGIEIVVATGRRHTYAMRVLRELQLTATNALISSNGTVIRSIGADLVHRQHMPRATALWLLEQLHDFRNMMVMTFDTVQPNGEDSARALLCEHLDDLHLSVNRWMIANAPYMTRVERFEDELANSEPIQMMLCGAVADMREAERVMSLSPKVAGVGVEPGAQTEITIHRTEYPDRDLSIVDILPVGCSKASALERLTELRGCTLDDVMAIGDNWNDVPMLQVAGRAILMANAPDSLLDIAAAEGWEIVPTNDDDGVAIAIESALSRAREETAIETAPMVVS